MLAVILFLLAVTAVVAPFVLAAQTGFTVAADALRKDRLDLLADGLVTALSRDLAAPRDAITRPPPSLRSVPAVCRTGRLAIEARLQDQRGLVDLNAAGEDLLLAGFRAVGLTPAVAASHARAVIAYRQPADDDPDAESDDGTEMADAFADALVLDGFKRGAFEAVEELYDFVALQRLPLRTLGETFTIHAPQPTILGQRMPPGLAALLPERPSPPFPFVTEEETGTPVYRIEVLIRSAGDAALGYAGAIVSASENEAGDFTIDKGTINPNVLPGGQAVPGDPMSCEQVFGDQVAALLRDFSG